MERACARSCEVRISIVVIVVIFLRSAAFPFRPPLIHGILLGILEDLNSIDFSFG
jgi:hypothetical protein